MKRIILIKLIFSVSIFAQSNLKYAETIKKSELEKHILILTSDSLEGRETGRIGQKKAAKYIADHFKKIGIPPSVTKKTGIQKE
tara:strand:+ start:1395 stop:1646 length:252 start_codon:yes stop_codon:yes gene_type:complete